LKFEQYLKEEVLIELYYKKLKNSSSMGLDGITTVKFGEIFDDEIAIIKRKVLNLTYNITPYKERLVVKNRLSAPRLISIPTNRDKLLFSALNYYLKDKFNKKLVNNSSLHKKILDIKYLLKSGRYDSFIKIDIENFYPSIDHNILLNKLDENIDDRYALDIIKKAISNSTLPKGRRCIKFNQPNIKGVPQGLSFSNILANIYMNSFDKKYINSEYFTYYRFVDDILILCNYKDISTITDNIKLDLSKLKLTTHNFNKDSNKSNYGTIHKDKFQYLGYQFFNNVVSVRESTVDNLKNQIVKICYLNVDNEKKLIRELNRKITGCQYENKIYGWLVFFALIDDLSLLYSLDAFIKKCFKKFNLKYEKDKVKSFVKTYFALKNKDFDYIVSCQETTLSELRKKKNIHNYGISFLHRI